MDNTLKCNKCIYRKGSKCKRGVDIRITLTAGFQPYSDPNNRCRFGLTAKDIFNKSADKLTPINNRTKEQQEFETFVLNFN